MYHPRLLLVLMSNSNRGKALPRRNTSGLRVNSNEAILFDSNISSDCCIEVRCAISSFSYTVAGSLCLLMGNRHVSRLLKNALAFFSPYSRHSRPLTTHSRRKGLISSLLTTHSRNAHEERGPFEAYTRYTHETCAAHSRKRLAILNYAEVGPHNRYAIHRKAPPILEAVFDYRHHPTSQYTRHRHERAVCLEAQVRPRTWHRHEGPRYFEV